MSTPTCPSCGVTLTEAKKFCSECGARLPEMPTTPTPTIRLDPPAPSAAETPTFVSSPSPEIARPTTPTPQGLPPVPTGIPLGSVPANAGSVPAPRGNRMLWWILGGVGCLGAILLVACVGILFFIGSRVDTEANRVVAPTGTAELPSSSSGGGIVPGDNPIAGGNVLLADNFDNPSRSSFVENEDSSSRLTFEKGAYLIEVNESDMVYWYLADGSYTNIVAEIDTRVPPGSAVVAAGLIFHYQDEKNFYLYSIASDGYYALSLLENDEWVQLIDWTQADVINPMDNTLRVETKAGRIRLFVNDSLLEETSDRTFTSGEFGLAVSSFEKAPASVRFDNLVIKKNE